MTTWLVALAGASGYGTRSFPGPAVYEADEEAERWAARQIREGSQQLVLVRADSAPTITTPPVGEALRDLRGWLPSVVVPRGGRVTHSAIPDERVLRHPDPQPQQRLSEAPTVPLDYACPSGRCDRRFPSAQVAALHAEVAHGPAVQAELAAQPEPPPPEPALTEA